MDYIAVLLYEKEVSFGIRLQAKGARQQPGTDKSP